MKFYNREKELSILENIKQRSESNSKMTIITGRRRIGKTRLILEHTKGINYLYFFIARKDEKLLCEEFTELIVNYDIPVFGEFKTFKAIFGFLLDYTKKHSLTLIIDEFQEFYRINPSVYSDIQNLWDQNKESTKMNLILSGSVYSLMNKIFENAKEPLFGRADEKLIIQPFAVDMQVEILNDFNPAYKPIDLLCFYMLTGGIPKYIEQFVDRKALTKDGIFKEILRENSIFLEEGKNVLIEEFGKDYTIYFSILSLLAASKTSRAEIENLLQIDIGGYLKRLETDYSIIQKHRPIFSKIGSRNVKYFIRDNFLNFWFRFIYKNRGAIEIQNFLYVQKIIERDFTTFSGKFLENYFKEKLALTQEYSMIGSYWEKGNQNEIDIIAINELEKKALIVEVKLQKKNISIPKLQTKAYNLMRPLSGYDITYKGYSLEDL